MFILCMTLMLNGSDASPNVYGNGHSVANSGLTLAITSRSLGGKLVFV